MTAQINDKVFFRQIDFALVARKGEHLLDLREHGIEPFMLSTACGRGYYIRYRVVGDHLCLAQVTVGLKGPQAVEANSGHGPLLFGVAPQHSEWKGAFLYDLPNQPLAFTGCLTLANDFIRELYVHAGFHPAWKYREVYELCFDQGRLTTVTDRSTEMAEQREYQANRPPAPSWFLDGTTD